MDPREYFRLHSPNGATLGDAGELPTIEMARAEARRLMGQGRVPEIVVVRYTIVPIRTLTATVQVTEQAV